MTTFKCLAFSFATRPGIAAGCFSIALLAWSGCNPVVQSNAPSKHSDPPAAAAVDSRVDDGSAKTASPGSRPSLTKLLSLIRDRLELMPGVAQAKWNRKLPITDTKREGTILDGLQAKGTERGLPPNVVRAFFQDQITAAKLIQEQHFADWSARKQPPFANPPDLEREIRPQIDRLNEQMLTTLAQYWASRSSIRGDDVDREEPLVFQASESGQRQSKNVVRTALKTLRSIAEFERPVP